MSRSEERHIPDQAPGDVFVGRTDELAKLRAGLERAISGRGGVFLVAGEPGIGKTRLAGELAAQAPGAGAKVLWGRCWEGEGAPAYWPWVQIIRTYIREREAAALRAEMGAGAADIAQIISEVHEKVPGLAAPPPLEPEHARFRLFDSITTFLKNAARAEPLLLILDDLHSADKASLLLLQFLAHEMAESRVVVVGTYRDVEVQRGHPLAEALPALRREPGHERILLRGLREGEVRVLLGARGGEGAPEGFVKLISRETEGNPFFIEEILRHLVEEGIVAHEGGRWRSRLAPDEMRIPEGVRDVIGRRLNHLSKDCNDLLAVASVIGREFDLGTLGPLSALAADRLQGLLEEAIGTRVLEEAPRALGRYRFSHTLIRETLYGELRTPRRLLLHCRTAEVLEALHAEDPEAHLPALAYHFFEAAHAGGDLDKAIAYAERAGARATELLAYDEAAAQYERALELLDLKPAADARRCDLLLAVGEALDRSGDLPRGNDAFEQAAALAGKIDAPERLARAALGRTGRTAMLDPPAVRLLEQALGALAEEDSGLRAMVLSRLANALSLPRALWEERAALSRQAVEMARRVGDRRALTYTLWAFWFWHTGWWSDIDETSTAGAEFLRLAKESGDVELIQGASGSRISSLLEIGQLEEADAETESFARRAEELRQPLYLWAVMGLKAMRAILDGRFDEGERLSLEALAMGRRMREPTASLACGGQLFVLRWDQGRLDEMEAPLVRAVGRYPELPSLRCNLAFLYTEVGREAEARRVFEGLVANEFGVLRAQAAGRVGACWLAEACVALQDAPRASMLYEFLLPAARRVVVLGGGLASSCVGSVSRQLGLLAATMSRWEDAERHFEDALEMHARLRARPFLARTRYEYARMLLAQGAPGDREKALGLLEQAIAAAQALGMRRVAERALGLRSEAGVAAEATGSEPTRPIAAFAAANLFRREGDDWTIAYEGKTFRMRDAKGLHYIARLLRHPGEEFHVADLVAPGSPGSGAQRAARGVGATDTTVTAGLGHAGEILDAQAKGEYRARLEDLRAELEEAEKFNDPERAAHLQGEIEFLTGELAAAYGLGGRVRRAGDAAERARKAVASRMTDSIARIRTAHPALGLHLANAIRLGTFCCYAPEKPVAWEL